MSVISKQGILHVKLHDFKDNISRYIRWMRAAKITSVLVFRHNDPVGLFVPYMDGKIVNPYSAQFEPDPKAEFAVTKEEFMNEFLGEGSV